jgi:hypothetical protein
MLASLSHQAGYRVPSTYDVAPQLEAPAEEWRREEVMTTRVRHRACSILRSRVVSNKDSG